MKRGVDQEICLFDQTYRWIGRKAGNDRIDRHVDVVEEGPDLAVSVDDARGRSASGQ